MKKNIIWLIPDGVRTIPYNDPLGRFEVFDELIKDGFFEFSNMYTTATSTFMSFSSFLSGIYSTKMATKYGELKALRNEVPHIKKILQKIGYNTYFFTWHADLKNQLNTFDTIEIVKNKQAFLDFHLSYDSKNRDIDYIKYAIKNEIKEPYCLFIHIAAKSFDDIEKTLDYRFDLEFYSLYEHIKNYLNIGDSLFIVHSDHGFPTVKDIDSPVEYFSHELSMSQSNIKVPFFIKFPDIKGKKVENNAILVDVVPTILKFLNLPKNNLDGINLLDLVNNKIDRTLRIENRFSNQQHCKICLVDNKTKIVYDKDNDVYKMEDLQDNDYNFFELKKYQKFNLLNNNFFKERDKLIYKMTQNKERRIRDYFNKYDIGYIKLYKNNQYLDDFLKKHPIINYKKSSQYILFLIEDIYDLGRNNLTNYLNNYDKEVIFILDTYLNLDVIKTTSFKVFLKSILKIIEEKKERNNRKRNSMNLRKENFFNAWKKRNEKW